MDGGVLANLHSHIVSEVQTASLGEMCFCLLLLVSAYGFYHLWYVPMDRRRSVDEVGYKHVPSGERKNYIARSRRNRKIGKVPPVFPNGWFVLAESRELPVGQILSVSALGGEYVIFRGEKTGRVFVTDAYCPHLGAHLGFGGKVEGDCITCPFHEWKFQGVDGKVAEVPYASKVPDFAAARLPIKTSVEVNNLIFIWHHAEDEEPTWWPEKIPLVDQTQKEKWTYQGRNEFEIACHIQDVPENGADVHHLPAIHKSTMLIGGEPSGWLEKAMEWLNWHDWGVAWAPETEEGQKHRATVHLKQTFMVAGGVNLFTANVKGEQIGPGLVHLHFQTQLGRSVMIQYVTPLGPLLQKIVHVYYTQPYLPPPIAKFILLGESILVERDIKVWNSKTYADQPVLIKEDNLIKKHRQWYSQFYSENSPTLQDIRDRQLDW